jgi:hypothetical protein
MKKFASVVLLGAILCTAGAFAEHPGGWGIGVLGRFGGAWTGGSSLGGAAISLKVPSVPVFWGIDFGFPINGFTLGVTGDYYLVDQYLIKNAGLGWFLGLGGFFGFGTYSYDGRDASNNQKTYNQTSVNLGLRLPIGLSWRPINLLELFIDFAPSLGVNFWSGNYYDRYNDNKIGLAGGWQGDIGIRLWF